MIKLFLSALIFSCVAIKAQTRELRTFPDMESKLDVHFPIENFKDKNGKPYDPNYLKGRTSLINLWFTACAPCIQEIPILSKIQAAAPQSNFIGITYDDDKKVEAFTIKHHYNFQQITNSGTELKAYLQVQRYPMSLIIGSDGMVKEVMGVITEEKMAIILKKLKSQ